MRKWNHVCSLLIAHLRDLCHYSWKVSARTNRLPKILFIKKQTQWLNDKRIEIKKWSSQWTQFMQLRKEASTKKKKGLELGYRKISWFVSGEQINYLPKPIIIA